MPTATAVSAAKAAAKSEEFGRHAAASDWTLPSATLAGETLGHERSSRLWKPSDVYNAARPTAAVPTPRMSQRVRASTMRLGAAAEGSGGVNRMKSVRCTAASNSSPMSAAMLLAAGSSNKSERKEQLAAAAATPPARARSARMMHFEWMVGIKICVPWRIGNTLRRCRDATPTTRGEVASAARRRSSVPLAWRPYDSLPPRRWRDSQVIPNAMIGERPLTCG